MEGIPVESKANAGAPHISSVPSSDDSSSEKKDHSLYAEEDRARWETKPGGPFVDADLSSKRWKPLDTYEGSHRYDPDFEWDAAEEKRLIRKIDWRVCTFVCLTFFALQLDRSNITQAVAGGMLPDLGLITNQYNNGQTIFYLVFFAAELPSQLISKWVGPDNWIPVQMVSWSLVASMQAFLIGPTSFYVTRALLGLFEGGFIPDNILYLSYWYTGLELPARLAWFWVSFQATSIVSAFMAFGVLHMDGLLGMAGWRWLFALEGTLTGLIGVFAWFWMPPSPTQTKGWFRGKKGWFSEHEEKILVNRILRDDPSKGDMHNRQAITLEMLWHCLKDYEMWPIYIVGLTWLTPTKPVEQYLTLTLKSVGFSTFDTNLLTIPAYVIFILNLLFWTWLSERLNSRLLVCLSAPLWNLPLLIALELLPAGSSKWAIWALSTLVVGSPYVHAILVAVVSRNAGAVRTRTVATALYNMAVQLSSVIGTQVYRTEDKPLYRTGNKVLIGLTVWSFSVFVFAKFYYVRLNKKRDERWKVMTTDEKQNYLATTKDEGSKRLDFRYAH